MLHLRRGSETYIKQYLVFEDENDCKNSYFLASSFKCFTFIVIECLIDTPIKMENKHSDHMMTRGISIWKSIVTYVTYLKTYKAAKITTILSITINDLLSEINLPHIVLKKKCVLPRFNLSLHVYQNGMFIELKVHIIKDAQSCKNEQSDCKYSTFVFPHKSKIDMFYSSFYQNQAVEITEYSRDIRHTR